MSETDPFYSEESDGADKSKVHVYPFTSLKAADILPAVPNSEEKMRLRKKLGMEG